MNKYGGISIEEAGERMQELQNVIRNARNELKEIDVLEKRNKNRKYEKKFYKYINSDGKREWYIYVSVIGISITGELCGWNFQKNYHGMITIENDASEFLFEEEISKQEFRNAWENLLEELNSIDIDNE